MGTTGLDHMTTEIMCTDLREFWTTSVGVVAKSVFGKSLPVIACCGYLWLGSSSRELIKSSETNVVSEAWLIGFIYATPEVKSTETYSAASIYKSCHVLNNRLLP